METKLDRPLQLTSDGLPTRKEVPPPWGGDDDNMKSPTDTVAPEGAATEFLAIAAPAVEGDRCERVEVGRCPRGDGGDGGQASEEGEQCCQPHPVSQPKLTSVLMQEIKEGETLSNL